MTGLAHVCAKNKDAGIECWGENEFNQTEIPNIVTNDPNHVGNIVAGPYNTCAYLNYG